MTHDYLIGGYNDVTFNSAQESYQWQLENAGLPSDLAAQLAEIFVKDDPNLPDLGRSEDEQALVQSAHQLIAAKGFF